MDWPHFQRNFYWATIFSKLFFLIGPSRGVECGCKRVIGVYFDTHFQPKIMIPQMLRRSVRDRRNLSSSLQEPVESPKGEDPVSYGILPLRGKGLS
ncbi:hypothetical protein AAC387_Pa05g2412 [Persea americana]